MFGVRCATYFPWLLMLAACLLFGCSADQPAPQPKAEEPRPAPRIDDSPLPSVLLGIDVLEADGFAVVKGKRLGLLTHPAGVNRRGVSTIDVLRSAPGVNLVCLFEPEHGLYGVIGASVNIEDSVDARTGLAVYSLHGKNRWPTPEQLKRIDAMVIDLQDIGVRSYTYNVAMHRAMESCFKNNVEVIVLDRPNPLGGVKVDGPSLDNNYRSGVGAFPVPYVHGLTMGELAQLAAGDPGVLNIPNTVRTQGRLTVIPMRGWRRDMRWPDTGLTFVPTSPMIQDFDAIIGYAMIGLGCEYSGFVHGVGKSHPFRGLSFKGKSSGQLIKDFEALALPGLAFSKISALNDRGKRVSGVYVAVTDWEKWNPTELSFHLMRLACRYNPPNPFAKLNANDSAMFNKHVGSFPWWTALTHAGAAIDVERFCADWRAEAASYREKTKKYWLYGNPVQTPQPLALPPAASRS